MFHAIAALLLQWESSEVPITTGSISAIRNMLSSPFKRAHTFSDAVYHLELKLHFISVLYCTYLTTQQIWWKKHHPENNLSDKYLYKI